MDEIKLLKKPKEASDLIIKLTGVCPFQKTRLRSVIEHRAFLCYILRTKFKMTYQSIADFIKKNSKLKTYDHSTVMHACNMYITYKASDFDEYFEKLESHFTAKPKLEYHPRTTLKDVREQCITLQEKYDILLEELEELKIYKLKSKIGLTKNEINYRQLGKDERKLYDERAALVLKSFEWKKPKNKYEVINCAS